VELRAYAASVVQTPALAAKLAPPPKDWTDDDPRLDQVPQAPARPPELAIRPRRAVRRLPSLVGMRDPRQRARILHALANHELQAAELFAWALLAYPDAPPAFRRGLLGILADEQRHTRMYIARVEALGFRFGDFPVTGYFWNKAPLLTTPLRFVCAMSLTFENANLDHTVDYAEAARAAGDTATAAVIDRVHRDEVRHVHFGWTWLGRLKAPEQTMWEAWCANIAWPLQPALARGQRFHPEGRVAAGLDPEFIRMLAVEERQGAPRGASRGAPRGMPVEEASGLQGSARPGVDAKSTAGSARPGVDAKNTAGSARPGVDAKSTVGSARPGEQHAADRRQPGL